MIDVNPNPLFIKDREGRFTRVNKAMADFYGTTTTAIVGKTDKDLNGKKAEVERILLQDKQIIETAKCIHIPEEEYTDQKTGEVSWFQTTKTPLVVAEDGKVQQILGITTNITDRKQNEKKLSENEQLLRAIFDASRDGIVIEDGSQIAYINNSYAKLLGYDEPEKLVGKHIAQLLPPDEAERLTEFGRRRLRGEEVPSIYEFKGKHKDGTLIEVEGAVSVSVIGGKRYIMTAVRDITDRKKAENEIRISEQRYRALITAGAQVVWLADADGQAKFVTPSWEELTGQTIEETRGWGWLDAFHPESRKQSERLWKAAVKNKTIYEDEQTVMTRDGTPRVFATRGVPLFDENGKIWEWMGMLTDITERKRAEEAQIKRGREATLRAVVGATLADGGATLTENLTRCAEAVVEHLDAALARIWTLDKGTETLELQASAGIYTHLDGAHARVRVGQFKIGLIAEEGKPYFTNDVFNDARVADKEWARQNNLNAFAGYPLMLDGKLIGVMAMFARCELTDATLEAMGGVANLIAQSIERKRAEEALRNNVSLLTSTFEATADGISVVALNNNPVTFNKKFIEMWRIPQEAAKTKNYAQMLACFKEQLKDWGSFKKKIEKSLLQPEAADFNVLEFKDGRFYERYSLPQIMDGKVVGRVFSYRDITERKQAENQMREAAERFRFLAESMPQKIFTARPSGEIDYFNRQWLEYTGLSFEQIRDWGWTQFIHHENYAEYVRSWKHSIETGEPFELEGRFRQADGEYRCHLNRARAMRGDDGEVLMWIGSNTDIHEHKLAEEELKVARVLLEAALDAGAIATWNYDIQNNLVIADKNMARLYSISPDDAAGCPVENYISAIHPDDRPQAEKDLAKAIFGESDFEINYRIIQSGGAVRWVETRGRIERDASGAAINMPGVAIDITERKEAEKALLESEERLRQSQKMEAIGTLTGGVAHDFNNLLTAILGNTQLAERTLAPDDPIRPRLTEIAAAGNRAAELTGKLLAFSRRQHLERRTVNLNTSVGEIVTLLERIIGADVEIAVKYGSDLPAVFADSSQIEQVVMNLAVNARDAMPADGKIVIETGCVELDESYCRRYPYVVPGKYVQIRVSDSGSGMDEKTQARIFEPFFTTKEIGKGTGLGLSMAYGIVKQHDGHINVYSEIGLGTTFKVYLPIDAEPIEDTALITLPFFSGGAETILIAEDEENLRNLAKVALEDLGYTVLLAKDGKEAVEIFAANRERIDLFLSDVVMP